MPQTINTVALNLSRGAGKKIGPDGLGPVFLLCLKEGPGNFIKGVLP